MNRKKMRAAFLLVIALFISYNIYQSQKKESVFNLTLANIEALANYENNGFPKDPFAGLGMGIYEKSITENYYKYDNKWINDTTYVILQTPVTNVDCKGYGKVACTYGVYNGNPMEIALIVEK